MSIQPLILHRGDKSPLSLHFTAAEWFSKSSDAPDSHPIYPPLVAAAEYLRTHFNTPWRLTSTFRTESEERYILKKMGVAFFVDQHMKGKAFDSHPVDTGELGTKIKAALYADFIATGPIYSALREMGITGFGIYDWGIHLDCRTDQFTAQHRDAWGLVARWDSRTGSKKKGQFGGAAFTPTATTLAPSFPRGGSSFVGLLFALGLWMITG